MVMYANEFETKEKYKLPELKINCNIHVLLEIHYCKILVKDVVRDQQSEYYKGKQTKGEKPKSKN